MQLHLVERAVGQDVLSALSNTIAMSILFVCTQIQMVAIHHVYLLVDLHTQLKLCIDYALPHEMHI